MAEAHVPAYTMGEEIGNAVSHGIGAMFSLIGYGYMLALSWHYGGWRSFLCSSVYCLTLFLMFICSACYHALPYPLAKRVMRILDHCAIALLIAGTYTPYMLISIRGTLGWTVFIVIWLAAVVSILLNAINLKRFAKLSFALYLVMGWMIVFTMKRLLAVVPREGMILLALGGLLYSIGIFFYVRKGKPCMHFVWHIFVLLGAMTHYFSILLYVLPAAFSA